MRSPSGIQQIDAQIGRQGPVIVLTGSVHARKWLFMEKASEPVPGSDPLQGLHDDLIMIDSDVGFFKDRSQLMLSRRHLVMLCLRGNSESPELLVDIFHIGRDPRTERSEIMIIQLLPLRRHRSEQRAAGEDQIHSLQIFFTVNNKILLLGADRRCYAHRPVIPEQPEKSDCLPVQRFH